MRTEEDNAPYIAPNRKFVINNPEILPYISYNVSISGNKLSGQMWMESLYLVKRATVSPGLAMTDML